MKNFAFLFLSLFCLLTGRIVAQNEYVPPLLPVIPDKQFNITDFGAVSDRKTDNTLAIQHAIDAAGKAGGGHVIVPAGDYLSGPLTFVDNLDLHLEEGATLLLLPIDRYPGGTVEGNSFISGNSLHDISITGKGTIDGQGSPWWPYAKVKGAKRPRMIVLRACNKILLEGVKLTNSPMFHIAINSENVTVNHVIVRAPASTDPVNPSHNTDACNVSGHKILIENCDISTGDDDYTCGGNTSDVRIVNNKYGYGHGLSIGSPTHGGVSNIHVENCTFENTECGIRIKSDRDRGGVVENISYRNLQMKNVGIPILIYESYNAPDKQYRNLQKITGDIAATYPTAEVAEKTPVFRNITFQNITATAQDGKRAGLIWGLPESLVENVVMDNVSIKATNSFGIYWANNIQLINCDFETSQGKNKLDLAKASVDLNGKIIKK